MLTLFIVVVLYTGTIMVMYQKNVDLHEVLKRNEDKIEELKRLMNFADHDSVLRSRVSNAESRITTLEKTMRTQLADVGTTVSQAIAFEVKNAVKPEIEKILVNDRAVTTNQLEWTNSQINQLREHVNYVIGDFDKLNTAQLYLAKKTLLFENANVCIFSSIDTCPTHLSKVATFGIITHSPDNVLPTGYFLGGKHNDNGWNWMHGGLCCMEQSIIQSTSEQ